MPHPQTRTVQVRNLDAERGESSRLGATFVGVFSGAILGAAMLLARPASTAMAPDSQAIVAVGVAPRHFVAGRVLDAEGNPVAGSAVTVRSDGRPGWDWVASSDADGAFHVEGVTPGKVHVVTHDIDGGSVESAPIDVADAHHVVLVLDRTLELYGTVLDGRGTPIARATLKLAGASGESRVVVTDDDGRYAVRAKVRSVERITVWARGFEATTLVLGAAANDPKRDVRLRAARAVRGVVVDPTGRAVSGARVSACPGKEAEVATSDRSGAFDLPATVVGCFVTADHPHFASSRAKPIRDGGDFVVRLGAGGAIEGDAVDEHGNPIGTFAVAIASFEPEEGAPAQPTLQGETSEHLRGAFRVDGLAPGTYVLRFSAEGRGDTDSSPIEVSRGRVMRGQHLVMMPAEVEEAQTVETSPESGETEAAPAAEPGSNEPATATSDSETSTSAPE